MEPLRRPTEGLQETRAAWAIFTALAVGKAPSVRIPAAMGPAAVVARAATQRQAGQVALESQAKVSPAAPVALTCKPVVVAVALVLSALPSLQQLAATGVQARQLQSRARRRRAHM